MEHQQELIAIGLISKPHNLQGALKVFPLTDFPERFFETDQVIVEINGQIELAKIEQVKIYKGFVVIGLEGIDNIEKAERFRGAYLRVPKAQLVKLKPGEYYIFELIGLTVKDLDGTLIGNLTDVLKTGANDVYVVRNDAGSEVLVPALKEIVKNIDLKALEMVIDMGKITG
ncbi:MAG: ribosome maturation factor RimM [Bacillota bacterium]